MEKKKLFILVITLLFIALCINVFGQTANYPFEVKISGKGNQVILLIPGFACSGEVWNDTKVLFEKEYICHALTMAGFAGVPAKKSSSFKEWEKGIADYIRENKIHKPILIGHSMGGGLAMAIAADFPELVSKIIVVDALPCIAALMNPAFREKETNDCSSMISKYTAIPDAQFYQMQKQGMTQLLADSSKQELVVGWSVRSDRSTFANMYCDFSNTDFRAKTSSIKCPALILLESYFVNFKPAIEGQFKNLETAQLQFATKGLHFIMYDDKEWYDKQLIEFLKK